MFATAVRWLIHQVNTKNPHFKKMGIKPEELQTQKLLKIVTEHGPIRPNDLWKHAEKVGIKSKIHMKKLLQWMRGMNMIFPRCEHASGDKSNPRDLVFYWKPVVFPHWENYRQKIRDKKYYINQKNKAKAAKEKAEKLLFRVRKFEKAKRFRAKQAQLAKEKFI